MFIAAELFAPAIFLDILRAAFQLASAILSLSWHNLISFFAAPGLNRTLRGIPFLRLPYILESSTLSARLAVFRALV